MNQPLTPAERRLPTLALAIARIRWASASAAIATADIRSTATPRICQPPTRDSMTTPTGRSDLDFPAATAALPDRRTWEAWAASDRDSVAGACVPVGFATPAA